MSRLRHGTARRRHLIGVVLVAAVLLAGGIVSGGAAVTVARARQNLATQTMDHHLQTVSQEIIDQVGHYGSALTDLAAGIGAQEDLTEADFQGMTAAMTAARLPGATGVAFAVPATSAQVAAVQARWRAQGAARLTLSPGGTSGPSASSAEHAYVVFQRPFGHALPPAGRDLAASPPAAEALRTARSTGAFTVGAAHLDGTGQTTFTLAAPVRGRPGTTDARTVHGWVTMDLRGHEFLQRTLHAEARDALRVHLSDPGPDGTDHTIASVAAGVPVKDPDLRRERTIDVGRRVWRLEIGPTTDLLGVADRRMTHLTAATGAAFTLLLAFLVATLTLGRNRAMDRVDQATAALRRDIERRQAVEERLRERENELRRLAFQDPLTGLANRSVFHDRVSRALTAPGGTFAVFFIDLDGFKEVNDGLGHSAGDAVLRAVADRLRECLREGDTVARFGGDEFAVLTERLGSPDEVHATARRIVAAVQTPVDLGGRTATVTASVGVSLNGAGDSADDILRAADLAMYRAKTAGKGRHVLADV